MKEKSYKWLWIISVGVILILGILAFMEERKINNPIVVIETSLGDIEIQLNSTSAPITTENFMEYVASGFYDETVFHRIIDGFMIQGGGFWENGTQKQTGEPIKLESRNGLKNLKGTIAMARTAMPDSATSQFFINLENNDFLDYNSRSDGYAVFGKVVNGMDVVEKIGIVQTGVKHGMEDWPVENVVIKRIYLK